MNVCKVCGKECNGSTCSGSCRAKLSMSKRTVCNFDYLPPGVTRPTSQPTIETHVMTARSMNYVYDGISGEWLPVRDGTSASSQVVQDV